MKNRIQTTAILTLASIAIGWTDSSVAQQNNIVKIDTGIIEGSVSGDILSFKGIPYAQQPIKNLRWRAPQPLKLWSGVRKTTEYGYDCMQKPVPSDAAPLGTQPSEDCLVLNVWRPATVKPNEKLPVMIWIHGGGYVNGGSSAAVYDGSAFARQGLVFVSLNYRLGRFGFFAHPALTSAKEGLLGNYGYLDQIEALRWVKRNISAFGGNPNQVTLVGESAGGASVLDMLASPMTKDLFHRAIVMSGAGRKHLLGGWKLSGGTKSQPDAEQAGINFAKRLRITGTGSEALAALRSLPTEKVVGDLNMLTLFASSFLPLSSLSYAQGPIIDDKIVTDSPGEIIRRGQAAKVPLIIGTTTQDLGTSFTLTKRAMFATFGPDADKARAIYDPDGKGDSRSVIATVAADRTMQEPARFVARQVAASGNPVWLYRFGYVAESERQKTKGAAHASEIPFVFDTLNARYQDVTKKDRTAARAINTYFANFVKYNDPNGSGLPNWSKFDRSRSDLMSFTLDNGPVMAADPWKERLDLVERSAEAQTSSPNEPMNLGGTSWQLVKFQSGNDTTITPDDKGKYTVAFGTDGRVSVRIDCNRGRGTWTSTGANQLQFGPFALTRAKCPPESLHDRIVKDLATVRSYIIKDGHLFLSLIAEGGVYEFEPSEGL